MDEKVKTAKSEKRKSFGIGIQGQVTVFIIVAVLLVSITAVIIAYKASISSGAAGQKIGMPIDSNAVSSHVGSCLAKAEPIAREILANYSVQTDKDFVQYNGRRYPYWCRQSGDRQCVNSLMSTKLFESQLSGLIKGFMGSCLNLSIYQGQGYALTEGEAFINVSIGLLYVDVYMTKEISLKKDGRAISLKNFHYRYELALGRMLYLGNEILNAEIAKGSFDKDKWMEDNFAEVLIEKNRPYPDTVYRLWRLDNRTNLWLELTFAVQGIDTVKGLEGMQPSFGQDNTSAGAEEGVINHDKPFGWCIVGDMCFYNAGSERCAIEGGRYKDDKPSGCYSPESEKFPACKGSACQDCGEIKSGEEWCVYDSAPGNGNDLVGSRHYKESCMNGRIFIEDCRDFREEICVSSSSVASCRDNRWQDCTLQGSEADCGNSDERDCYWLPDRNGFDKSKYAGNKAPKCFPSVPPGFRFWQLGGLGVCQSGNEWIDCDGLSCPLSWARQGMIACDKLGDCGRGYSIGGGYSDKGFLSSDSLDGNLDLNSSLLAQYSTQAEYQLNLPLVPFPKKNMPIAGAGLMCDDCTVSQLLDRMKEFAEYLQSLKPESLAMQMITGGGIKYHVRQFSLCMPYTAAIASDCKSCDDPFFPCSEYKCRSIGENCVFSVDSQGYGRCRQYSGVGDVRIIPTSVGGLEYNDFEDEMFGRDVFGKHIRERVPALSPFVVWFDTDRPAVCSKSFLPVSYSMLPVSLDLPLSPGEGNLSTRHEFVVYAMPQDYLKSVLGRYLNFTSYMQFIGLGMIEQKMDDVERNVLSAMDKAGSDTSLARAKFSALRQEYADTYKPRARELIASNMPEVSDMLNRAENGRGMVFFNCMDGAGFENRERFFISYDIGADTAPPMVLSSQVDNDKPGNPNAELNITVNEPSLCRASFSDKLYADMEYEMKCSDNYFSIDKGYPCRVSIPKSEAGVNSINEIFFRCRDMPYEENISKANVNTVSYSLGFH